MSIQGTIKVHAQRFEHGFIVYMRIPRTHAPNQWFILLNNQEIRSQFWSFITPIAFLGPDAQAYCPKEHRPVGKLLRPDVEFGALWLAVKDLLGWGLIEKEVFEIPVEVMGDFDPYLSPSYIPGPEGVWIKLNGDGTWASEDEDLSAAA